MLLKLLYFAAVQASVISCNVDDQEVVGLSLLHYYQLNLGFGEALCVVSIEFSPPHVHFGKELLVSSIRRMEKPA